MEKSSCCATLALLLVHFVLLTMAKMPLIQTRLIKGVPDAWAANTENEPIVRIGQKFYFIEKQEQRSWFDAAHDCRQRKSHLASIENNDELNALADYFKAHGEHLKFWTSGNNFSSDSGFRWLGTGNQITAEFLHYILVSALIGAGNCVLLDFSVETPLVTTGHCQTPVHFLCETQVTTLAISMWS